MIPNRLPNRIEERGLILRVVAPISSVAVGVSSVQHLHASASNSNTARFLSLATWTPFFVLSLNGLNSNYCGSIRNQTHNYFSASFTKKKNKQCNWPVFQCNVCPSVCWRVCPYPILAPLLKCGEIRIATQRTITIKLNLQRCISARVCVCVCVGAPGCKT